MDNDVLNIQLYYLASCLASSLQMQRMIGNTAWLASIVVHYFSQCIMGYTDCTMGCGDPHLTFGQSSKMASSLVSAL